MTVRTARLANGLRIVTDRMDSVETVSLGVWVDAGTRNEPAEINGVSHLLEHMAFKGTERRSALDIAAEIEDVGGQLNAYTSRETTVYYATVLKENVALGLDIVSDILLHSTFDDDELARERAVVLQEIGQANDTPDDIIFDWFQEAAFPDQPLGRPVLGTSDIVGKMPREALVRYMNGQYGADRMVLAAAGNLDHDAFVALAEKAFSAVGAGAERAAVPGIYAGGDWRELRDLEQVHFVLGFGGVGSSDPDYYPLAVYSTALGGGMSSRLFQEVREKRGLVYSIYSFSSSYRDCGLFGLYAGTGEAELAELVGVVADELRRAASERMDEAEVARARMQIKAGVLMSLESTSSRAERLARHMMVYGRPLTIAEISERIDSVTADDVRRIASRTLETAPTLAALGPIGSLEDYGSVAGRLGA